MKTAIRIQDQKLVVTKFIQKNKIHASQWRQKISSTVKMFKDKCKIGGSDNVLGEENHRSKEILRFPDEIDILLTLDHPNIIKYYETFNDKKYLYL